MKRNSPLKTFLRTPLKTLKKLYYERRTFLISWGGKGVRMGPRYTNSLLKFEVPSSSCMIYGVEGNIDHRFLPLIMHLRGGIFPRGTSSLHDKYLHDLSIMHASWITQCVGSWMRLLFLAVLFRRIRPRHVWKFVRLSWYISSSIQTNKMPTKHFLFQTNLAPIFNVKIGNCSEAIVYIYVVHCMAATGHVCIYYPT